MLPKDLTGKYQSSVSSRQSPVTSLQSSVSSLQSSAHRSSGRHSPCAVLSLHDWMGRNSLPVKVIVSVT